jgi:putative spermidine/putrescine transport system ATP-binding protein
VFNLGRVVQIGTPSEIYERPATKFVAGFVGISNLVNGEAARSIIGEDRSFAVRPEKIHLRKRGEAVQPGSCWVDGVVQEVIYLGMYTRYLVALDPGSELTVVQQNLETTSMDVLAQQGQPVRLVWDPVHNLTIGE